MPAPAVHNGEVDQLWNAYWEGRTDAARNALMERYLPMVRFAAQRLAGKNGRRPRTGEVDDLFQYGVFGLKDAIRGFDPTRGVKFETYCLQRVRGAMLDGLKTNQWLPREIRQRVNRFAVVQEQVQAEHGAMVPAETAARLGVCEDAVHELQCHASRQAISSLHAADVAGGDISPADLVQDHREEEAELLQQRRDVRDLFLRQLTRVERQLMMLYYYEELTMREVGEVLGISGTRVSQMHSDIVKRLRESLSERVADTRGGVAHALEL